MDASGKTIVVTGRSRKNIERRALSFLSDHMSMDGSEAILTPVEDWVEFEMEEAVGVHFTVSRLGAGVEAVTLPMKDGSWSVVMDEDAYNAMRAGDPRFRFTVGHEIGHVVLHRNEVHEALVSGAPGMRRDRNGIEPYRQAEWQANAFAAALLAPALAVVGMCQNIPREQWVSAVARTFGLSRPAAEYRVNDLTREGWLR